MAHTLIILPQVVALAPVGQHDEGDESMGRGGAGQGAQHGGSFDVIIGPHPIDLRDRGGGVCVGKGPYHMHCGLDTGVGRQPELLRRGCCLKLVVVLLGQGATNKTADDIPARETTDP